MRFSYLMGLAMMGPISLACSSGGGTAPPRPEANGASGAAGASDNTGNTPGAGGSTEVSASGGMGSGFFNDPGDEPLAPDGGCEAISVQGEKVQEIIETPVTETKEVPAVFYIMQDRSGSMQMDDFALGDLLTGIVGGIACLFDPNACPDPNAPPPAAPPSKWSYAVDGLNTFVNDPGSAGMEVALHYFPQGGQCDGSGYDMPTVPMGPLPQNAAAIANSLAAQMPRQNTPIEGALRGVTQYCLNYNATTPDKNCVAVLITDGQPTDCNQDPAALVQIAADAAAQGVITFAAGMEGADFNLLEQIAQAGGGNCEDNGKWACDLTASPTAFVDALIRIRQSVQTVTRTETRVEETVTVLPCEWTIPDPPEGKSFDKSLVNVDYSLPGAPVQSIGAVATEAECAQAADGGGWFYDNPAQPAAIKVCPNTCSVIQSSAEGRVDIKLGCATTPAVLR